MFKPARRPVIAGDPLLPTVNAGDEVVSPISYLSYYTFKRQSRGDSALCPLLGEKKSLFSVTFEHPDLLEDSAANAVYLESKLGLECFVVQIVQQNLAIDLLFYPHQRDTKKKTPVSALKVKK